LAKRSVIIQDISYFRYKTTFYEEGLESERKKTILLSGSFKVKKFQNKTKTPKIIKQKYQNKENVSHKLYSVPCVNLSDRQCFYDS